MKKVSMLSVRLLLCTMLAMFGATAMTAVGLGWHQLKTQRAAQRSSLLGLTFSASTELRRILQESGHTNLPVQLPIELQDKLRQRLSGLDEASTANMQGITAEVVRYQPEAEDLRVRYWRSAAFSISEAVATDPILDANLGVMESVTLMSRACPTPPAIARPRRALPM
jgi:hypothetical protein